MALQQSQLVGEGRILDHGDHGGVHGVDVGEGAFGPCLLGDPWRFFEDTAEFLDEGGLIHRVDRRHVDVLRRGRARGQQQGAEQQEGEGGAARHGQLPR